MIMIAMLIVSDDGDITIGNLERNENAESAPSAGGMDGTGRWGEYAAEPSPEALMTQKEAGQL
jgi:hypothetical protein